MRSLTERLAECGQSHLVAEALQFSAEEAASALRQFAGRTAEFARWQREAWERRVRPPTEMLPFAPEKVVCTAPVKKAGVLILAGGQGSRLGFDGPKGCYPVLGKSLFEHICRRIEPCVPLAVMTSPLNDQETRLFFTRCESLRRPVFFFSQGMMPLLDGEGRWFWQKPGRLAEGPDGNGSVFAAFASSGGLQHFFDAGVDVVHILSVDNPLAQPLDPVLAAFHEGEQADLTLSCVRVKDPAEPMGRLVRIVDALRIVEFAELGSEEARRHLLANSGRFVCSLSLMKELSRQEFPLHFAFRSSAWKGERFIVDALQYARRPQAIEVPRRSCYAALKDKSSLAEIEQLLSEKGFMV